MGVLDTTRDVTYRGYKLNDKEVQANLTSGGGIGTGISGCVIDSDDFSDVDIVQFLEKRSQQDGMDAGDPFKGMRRVRLSGTLYARTRALMFDAIDDLSAALDPILSAREIPADRGYQPLYWSQPTNRIADFPSGAIGRRILAMPRALSLPGQRDWIGGDDDDSVAATWQATFVCRDPSIQGDASIGADFTAQTLVTGATAENTGDTITKAGHGLIAGDRIRFITLTGGTGLSTSITYYVINPVGSTFQVSLTSGGSAVAVNSDYSTVTYVKSITDAGTVNNRGNYIAPINAIWEVGAGSGTISATIGDSIFTITVPASTVARTIRFNGEDKFFTSQEAGGAEVPHRDWLDFSGLTTWPLVDPGDSAWSFTHHGLVVASGSRWWMYERYAG